jgi:hypothetical protein
MSSDMITELAEHQTEGDFIDSNIIYLIEVEKLGVQGNRLES